MHLKYTTKPQEFAIYLQKNIIVYINIHLFVYKIIFGLKNNTKGK